MKDNQLASCVSSCQCRTCDFYVPQRLQQAFSDIPTFYGLQTKPLVLGMNVTPTCPIPGGLASCREGRRHAQVRQCTRAISWWDKPSLTERIPQLLSFLPSPCPRILPTRAHPFVASLAAPPAVLAGTLLTPGPAVRPLQAPRVTLVPPFP